MIKRVIYISAIANIVLCVASFILGIYFGGEIKDGFIEHEFDFLTQRPPVQETPSEPIHTIPVEEVWVEPEVVVEIEEDISVETKIEYVEVEEVVPEVLEEVEPEEEFVSHYQYTEEELDLLSRLIYSESGTESYDTKLKIGSVVMNRVEDPYFPNSIQEVIYQENQFSVTTIYDNGVPMIDRPADEESIKAAKYILDYGSVLPQDVQVFYSVGCPDGWVNSRVTYEVCDSTVFAYIYSN